MTAGRVVTHQPDGTMRRRGGGAVRERREDEGAQEDKMAARREATQQTPTCAMRGREGGATRGR